MSAFFRRNAAYLLLALLLAAFAAFGWLLRGWIRASSATALRHELSSLMNQADRLSEELELELAFMEETLMPGSEEFLSRDGKAFGGRWEAFHSQARFPGLLKEAYFYQNRSSGLYRFDPAEGSFAEADPRSKLASIVSRFASDERPKDRNLIQSLRDFLAEAGDGDSYRVYPVTTLDGAEPSRPVPRNGDPAFFKRLERTIGFLVLALDDSVISGEILPNLGDQYFGEGSGYGDFVLRAVAPGHPDGSVPLGSGPGAAGMDWRTCDFSRPIFSQRSRLDIYGIYATARGAPGDGQPPMVGELRIREESLGPFPGEAFLPIDSFRFTFGGGRQGWTIQAKHRSGSIQKAVSRRTELESLLSFAFLSGVYLLIAGLVLSYRRARFLSERERDFIASVSHELKTPIAVMLTAAENMEKGIVAPERVGEYGAMLAKEGRRLRDSVEGILMVSGFQSAHRGSRSETFRLADLAREAAAKMEDLAASRSARLTVVEEQKPIVKASRALLCTALTSIVSNALRYGPPGGEVLLRVRASGSAARRKAEIAVEDRGPGIGYAERSRVFDPFWRGSAAAASGQSGTGLGLYLARRIARLHSGDVAYKPRQGGGACFILSLPEEIEA